MQATHDDSEGCRVAGGVKGWTNPVAREVSRSWEGAGVQFTARGGDWRLVTSSLAYQVTLLLRVICFCFKYSIRMIKNVWVYIQTLNFHESPQCYKCVIGDILKASSRSRRAGLPLLQIITQLQCAVELQCSRYPHPHAICYNSQGLSGVTWAGLHTLLALLAAQLLQNYALLFFLFHINCTSYFLQ